MDDEVDEEEVKLWDTRKRFGQVVRNVGGAMEWITLVNPLMWSLIWLHLAVSN